MESKNSYKGGFLCCRQEIKFIPAHDTSLGVIFIFKVSSSKPVLSLAFEIIRVFLLCIPDFSCGDVGVRQVKVVEVK